MIKFYDKKKKQERYAYRIFTESDNTFLYVQYEEMGKEYIFRSTRIEILEGEVEYRDNTNIQKEVANDSQIIIYSIEQHECCYCGSESEVLTYLLFNDGTNENVTYPWDLKRLTANRTPYKSETPVEQIMGRFSIKTLGTDKKLDQKLLGAFPKQLRNMTDEFIDGKRHPMNICNECKNEYDNIYLREDINNILREGKRLKIVKVIEK